jgi:regulator of protease activity HflC (stomatin/prohibitin superfamily)
MDETPFFRKPWFYIVGWLFSLLVLYGWQIYRIGDIQADIINILIDLVCLFPALLLLWIAFFAQFILPVRTVADRQEIVDRLLTYLSGGHGPALFIENGKVREHVGERLKKGPGVVWLDSASAAVTRTATKIKQVMGPGVHFLDSREFFAGTVDLHIQSHELGPKETDKPFNTEDQGDAEFQHVQDRRKQVSAWTRDGIEVVPNISVAFRIDTGFPKEGKPGSRFGYRTGITKKDRENEAKDKEVIQKAILGEGVNPNISVDSPRHRVAWNQLPSQLAVDVWREYVAKFTLDQLFKPEQIVPPPPPPAPEPVEEEIDPLTQPLLIASNQNRLQNSLTAMIREINKLMNRTIKWLEGSQKEETPKPPPAAAPPAAPSRGEPLRQTALQAINDMVKARLTQPQVDVLDDHGKLLPDRPRDSEEYRLLQSRGLKVLNVRISNIRFHPTIEDTIINRWSASWLKTAEDEKKQIERRRNILETAGQEQAIRKYAEKLSADLIRRKPSGVSETLKTLIMRTRGIIIENEQLRRDMTEEQEVIEEIIKWMELNGK